MLSQTVIIYPCIQDKEVQCVAPSQLAAQNKGVKRVNDWIPGRHRDVSKGSPLAERGCVRLEMRWVDRV